MGDGVSHGRWHAVTVWDILRACLRRWPIVLLGLVLTAGGFVQVMKTTGVYWAQSEVVFLSPQSARYPNSLQSASNSLVELAGLIEREVNDGRQLASTASSEVTIIGQGITEGSEVALPNAGGQWTYYFNRPVLDVQAAGASPDEVTALMNSAFDRISSSLDGKQQAAGVAGENLVTLDRSPREIKVQFAQGDRQRAAAAELAIGFALMLTAVVLVDSGLRRRTRRKRSKAAESSAEHVETPVANAASAQSL